MRFMLLLLTACDFSASTTVIGGDTNSSSDSGETGSDLTGDSVDSGESTDGDGDGYGVEDGDCDDSDASIAPGLVDDCDGVDTDCDGDIDEDASSDSDGYEPNDEEGWFIGTLDDGDQFLMSGYLHNDADVDRFVVHLDDDIANLFELEIELTGIPESAVYELELLWVNEDELIYSDSGSDTLGTTMSDTVINHEEGDYQIQIRSLGGAPCGDPYFIEVIYTEWGL
jgi:hypothetical protein